MTETDIIVLCIGLSTGVILAAIRSLRSTIIKSR